MTIDPNEDELAYALSQQREDAYFHAQVLRDLLVLAGDIGFALKQHSIVVATERPLTGGPARGADLTPSFERLSRAVRRNAMLAQKVRADMVAHCRANPALHPIPTPPEPPTAAPDPAPLATDPQTRPQPTPPGPPTPARLDRLDNDRDEVFAEDDVDWVEPLDREETAEPVPDRPVPELIADIRQVETLVAPHADAPAAPPAVAPKPSPRRWADQAPPLEPATPGILALAALRARAPADNDPHRHKPPPD